MNLHIKKIKNKFPNEPIPSYGYKLDYYISDGSIKGIEGRKGNYDFVITKDNELMIGSKHHYLGNTEDVIAAGQIKINGHGMVKRIDNLSGHYQPSVYQAMQYQGLFRDLLVDQDIELYNLDIYMFPIEENKNYNSTDDMFRLVQSLKRIAYKKANL